ncbi:hypothetical protein [Blautia intestinalis]|uniref:phage lytic cycle repressor MrpR family protein n=1 Tax=Blautia intestinalis TaxID=2763028 RepID=UPI0022E22520|nr:hypothetical protein [Blautia intestinalis]
MYNEFQKSRYFNFLEKNESGSINVCSWMFDKIENFEINLNKDVYDFTLEEMIYMYKMFDLRNINTLMTINSLISQYTKWALTEGLVKSNQNVAISINIDRLRGCLNKVSLDLKIISREDLLDIINQFPNPRDRFILLALFEFGKGENFYDIALATMKSINYDDLTMTLYSNRTVKVSRELIYCAQESIDADVYYRNITNPDDKVQSIPLYDNGTIIKTIRQTDDKNRLGRNAYRSASVHLESVNPNLSIKNIIESGKVQFIKDDMKKLNITTLDEYFSFPDAMDRIHKIQTQFMCSRIIVKRFIATYGDLF